MFSDVAAFIRGTVHNHTPVRTRTRLQPGTAVHVCCRLVPGIACSLRRPVIIVLHQQSLHIKLERKLINESNRGALGHLSCRLQRQWTVATGHNEVQITNCNEHNARREDCNSLDNKFLAFYARMCPLPCSQNLAAFPCSQSRKSLSIFFRIHVNIILLSFLQASPSTPPLSAFSSPDLPRPYLPVISLTAMWWVQRHVSSSSVHTCSITVVALIPCGICG